MTEREALKLALEALERYGSESYTLEQEAINAIKEVLAQPEQEPVAWLQRQGNFTEACMNRLHDDEIDRGWTEEPLYTTPPHRTLVGLTDEEINQIERHGEFWIDGTPLQFARAIEVKLKEKNT